ncbi:hypothetical protein GPALN_005083 [Globodera pallida]|nr:hypothetical protein GPALN_005083 [Globodera pallida]
MDKVTFPHSLQLQNNQQEITKKKMRHLPSEVWHAVLGFICCSDLSQSVSLTCARFSAISNEWLAKRNTSTVPPLEFRRFRCLKRGHDRSVAYRAVLRSRGNDQNWPIADVPPPAHFGDFSSVKIRYFDDQVLAFLRNLQPLFVKIKLFIFFRFGPKNLAAFGQILPLLAATEGTFALVIDCFLDKTTKFGLIYQNHEHILERNVYLVAINYFFCTDFGRRITGQEMEEEISLLLQWLQQTEPPIDNGKVRMLAVLRPSVEFRDRLIELALEAFLDAQRPANFLIRFEHTDHPDQYTLSFRHTDVCLDNATTGEHCSLCQFDQQNWFLRRCPLDDRLKKEEKGEKELQNEKESHGEMELKRKLLEVWDKPVSGWPTRVGCQDRQSIVLNCDNYGIFRLEEDVEEGTVAENSDDLTNSGPSMPKRLREA